MNPQDVFDAIDRYLRDATRSPFKEGTVIRIAGNTVMVSIPGGANITCSMPSTNIAVGDTVMLINSPRTNRYVILSSFKSEKSGALIEQKKKLTTPKDIGYTSLKDIIIWKWTGEAGASYHAQISIDRGATVIQDVYTSSTQVSYVSNIPTYLRVREVGTDTGDAYSEWSDWTMAVSAYEDKTTPVDVLYSYTRFS